MSFDTTVAPYNANDPTASFLSTSCLDFLMIELVPLSHRITQQLGASLASSAGASATETSGTAGDPASGMAVASSTTGGASTSTSAATPSRKMDDEEERDAVSQRLEGLGYRVGQGLVERFSRDRPRFNDTLDAIKFLCKDIWSLVFGKQVDNLKTNHRGVYVLTDGHFRPIMRMSTDAGGQAVVRAKPFLCFPAGVVRGALSAMGITATVQAEATELPTATFHIKTLPMKS